LLSAIILLSHFDFLAWVPVVLFDLGFLVEQDRVANYKKTLPVVPYTAAGSGFVCNAANLMAT